MRIYHIATAADWSRARASGEYTTSTLGRSLVDEGFIHAARREQVGRVFRSFYADVTEPLVLLTIETDRLGVPWREEPVGKESYPHVYGPIPRRAVVAVEPLDRRGGTRTMGQLFLQELMRRALLGTVALLPVALGAVLGDALAGPVLGLVLAGVGLGLGVLLLRWGLSRPWPPVGPGR